MKKKIKRMIRKIRRKMKKIKKSIFIRKRFYYKKTPVFTVKEICKIIGISVPEKYKEIKNSPVHQTVLFDALEGKDEIIQSICYKRIPRKSKYNDRPLKLMERFCERYENQKDLFKGTDEEMLELLVAWLYVFYPLGYYANDYFDYELYHRTTEEAKKFLSRRFCWKTYEICNNKDYIKYLKNKEEFNKKFSKYVHRKSFDIFEMTFEEFEKFAKTHPKFFAKPIEGTGGNGAGIIKVSDYKDIKTLYEHCKKEHFIIEEVVKQHKEMAQFNESTVNTIRVYSLLCKDGKVRVLMATARFGRVGNDVDNFHCGGVGACVDVKTGKIMSDAMDRNHHFYDRHPDSKLKFKGFQIPCWDKLVKAIEESGQLLKETRHIGWDVAITEAGEIEFIEGNSMPNFDIAQTPDQVGKAHLYEKYIKELEEQKE